MTDHYAAELEWADGFRASFVQSWVAPADDGFTGSALRVMGEEAGFDFSTGALTFRDRSNPRRAIEPGAQPDTRLALEAFLASQRARRDSVDTGEVGAALLCHCQHLSPLLFEHGLFGKLAATLR